MWTALSVATSFCSVIESTNPGYDKRFTRYTPRNQGTSYLRILGPVHGPSGGASISSLICRDVKEFLVALCAIRDALGIYVPGLGTRAGHRAAAGAGIAQRGGRRVNKAAAADSEWVHLGAVGPRAQFLARSKKRYPES